MITFAVPGEGYNVRGRRDFTRMVDMRQRELFRKELYKLFSWRGGSNEKVSLDPTNDLLINIENLDSYPYSATFSNRGIRQDDHQSVV